MSLGLDTLTDDQIVEFARELGAEINRRHPGVADAATAAIRDEIAKAALSNDAVWTVKKWLGTMVFSHLGKAWTLTVWLSQDRSIMRVYLETPGPGRREDQKWCFSVTGDKTNPPGHLTIVAGSSAEKADGQLVRIICREAANAFPAGVRIECDLAVKTEYDIPPMPADFSARLAELQRAKERTEFEKTARYDSLAEYRSTLENLLAAAGVAYQSLLPQDQQETLRQLMLAANAELTRRMAAYDQETTNG